MPVKIRLTRMGKKKQPSYRVVVVDSRKPRDGAYIEQIGRYDPRAEPSVVEIDNDRAVDWLHKGAQPTERARKLLEISGAWTQFRVDRGDIHTVPAAAPTPEPPAPTPVVPDHEPEIHVVGGDASEDADEAASPESPESPESAESPDSPESAESPESPDSADSPEAADLGEGAATADDEEVS